MSTTPTILDIIKRQNDDMQNVLNNSKSNVKDERTAIYLQKDVETYQTTNKLLCVIYYLTVIVFTYYYFKKELQSVSIYWIFVESNLMLFRPSMIKDSFKKSNPRFWYKLFVVFLILLFPFWIDYLEQKLFNIWTFIFLKQAV